ncbi:MAG: carbohydrate porin [Burkholderiales bacterium]|nr:carbohydrate porin [Phycisphaerae bacterium]
MRQSLLAVAAIAMPIFCAAPLRAQTSLETNERFERLEKRLTEMEQKHQREIESRDDEIARLKAQLANHPDGPPAQAPAAATGSVAADTTADILNDINARRGPLQMNRLPASFNPDVAVITDWRSSISTHNNNHARNRFDVAAVELDFRAAVDPRADAVAIIPIVREVEDPLFFDPTEEPEGGPETAIEIEEAYLFLHDFGVPNLTAKLGRFHLRFGRQNVLHAHDWPTFDNNFVNQSFLGGEALSDSGLSLSYVIPPERIGNHYVEIISEIITGEGGGAEAPVLNNNALVDGPAFNTHVLWNYDIADAWNLELGGSWLTGRHNNDNQQSANLFGIDMTLIHTDPTGGFNNQLFQAEAIYGITDTSRDETQHAFGAYVLAQQQINRDWYIGIRGDWTQNAVDDSQSVWGVSPYVSWYWSEFLRFRMQYQHKDGDTPAEDNLFFQVTWIFGAHPPHPYWSMR